LFIGVHMRGQQGALAPLTGQNCIFFISFEKKVSFFGVLRKYFLGPKKSCISL
jgi:hypothetical protein